MRRKKQGILKVVVNYLKRYFRGMDQPIFFPLTNK